MSGDERGFTASDDDEEEEVLQSSLAAALSSGDEARVAELRALLADPLRLQRREFQRQHSRHLRHQQARRHHTPGGE